MDFLPQERARGITISSAAISIPWKRHRLNLIDTPGHVDFTVEVERSLRVLDGALVILDSCSGVEAQTQTVWRQADKRHVPKVVVANKLDRDGASVWLCKSSIEQRLGAKPLLLYLPVGEASRLSGFIDLLRMEFVAFEDTTRGQTMTRTALRETEAPFNSPSEPTHSAPEFANDRNRTIGQDAILARERLIETLADLDDEIAVAFLDAPDSLHWTHAGAAAALGASIRRQTLACRAVPIVCASAFKNKGVQLALDAVIAYLPSPVDRASFAAYSLTAAAWSQRSATDAKAPLVALAFKVVHDRQKGFLTYLRIYSGQLSVRDNLLNTGSAAQAPPPALTLPSSPSSPNGTATAVAIAAAAATPAESEKAIKLRIKNLALPKERAMRLVEVFGADMTDIEHVSAGGICAALGLKNVRTGDTLVHAQNGELVALPGIDAPAPVFFCAIEAESQADQAKLDDVLRCVMQEDPSVSLSVDDDTGQTLLRGQGELHLEIVHRRLVDDFKCKVTMGGVRVAYRETIVHEIEQEVTIDKAISTAGAF